MNRLRDSLLTISECTDTYGSMVTNRYFSMRRLKPLIEAGYVKSIGEVEMVDGDLWEGREPKIGYVLTDLGSEKLDELL